MTDLNQLRRLWAGHTAVEELIDEVERARRERDDLTLATYPVVAELVRRLGGHVTVTAADLVALDGTLVVTEEPETARLVLELQP